MKATFNVEDVSTAFPMLAKVAGTALTGTSMIELSCEGGDDSQVVATARGADVSAAATFMALECDRGNVALDAVALAGIVAKAGAPVMSIEAGGNVRGKITVHCGGDVFHLATAAASELDWPDGVGGEMAVDSVELADALDVCERNAAKRSANPAMNGVNIHLDGDGDLACAALDGVRGVIARVGTGLDGKPFDVTLPMASSNAIRGAIKAALSEVEGGEDEDEAEPPPEAKVSVNEAGTLALIEIGRYTLASSTISGAFPPLLDIVPREAPATGAVSLDADEANDALALVKVCAKDTVALAGGGNGNVRFEFAGSDDRGNEATVTISGDSKAGEIRNTYGAEHLAAAMAAMSDDRVTMWDTGDGNNRLLCIHDGTSPPRRRAIVAPKVDPMRAAMESAAG